MARLSGVLLLLALAGCSMLPPAQARDPSPCVITEVSYDCQLARYQNAP